MSESEQERGWDDGGGDEWTPAPAEEASSEATAEEGSLDQLVDEMAEVTAELVTQVEDHGTRLNELEQTKTVEEPRSWLERHPIAADWSALADWVDWVNASYSLGDAERIPPCWPAHPGLVMELAGLRSAWAQAMVNDEKAHEVDTTVAAFHDYHFWPFIHRLADRARNPCGQSGHKADVEHQPTARSYFPSELTDEETGEIAQEGAGSGRGGRGTL